MRHFELYLLTLTTPLVLSCAHAPPPVPPPSPVVSVASLPPAGAVRERTPIAPDVTPAVAATTAVPSPTAPLVSVPAGPYVQQPPPVEPTEPINDERILEIAHVTDATNIDRAKLAEVRAVDPRVKELARTIVRQHSQAERDGADVARMSQLNPQTSDLSAEIQTNAHDKLDALGSKMGSAFDRAYIDAQVDSQRETLRLIDNRLLPSATTDEVKGLVERLRPEIANQYDQAKALQQKLKE